MFISQVPATQMLTASQICMLEGREQPSSAQMQQIIDQIANCNKDAPRCVQLPEG